MSRGRRVGDDVAVKSAIRPVAQAAATVNGLAVERKGALSAVLKHTCGATAGAPTSFSVASVLQDSDDGSTGWATIAAAATPTNLTAVNTEASAKIDLSVTTKKWVRVQSVVSFVGGTTPTVAISAELVLGGQRTLPAS